MNYKDNWLCRHRSRREEYTSVMGWNEEVQREFPLGKLCLECSNTLGIYERALKRAMRALPKTISIHGRKWFNPKNGNTYFSAYALVDGSQQCIIHYAYSCGDQYIQEVFKCLQDQGIIPQAESLTAPWHWIHDVLGCQWFWDEVQVRRKCDL